MTNNVWINVNTSLYTLQTSEPVNSYYAIPASILKDFIRDDHDHSFSISSLSVQLYTTPTLAHHLIAKQDALFVVMNTFVSECNRRCNNVSSFHINKYPPNCYVIVHVILEFSLLNCIDFYVVAASKRAFVFPTCLNRNIM